MKTYMEALTVRGESGLTFTYNPLGIAITCNPGQQKEIAAFVAEVNYLLGQVEIEVSYTNIGEAGEEL